MIVVKGYSKPQPVVTEKTIQAKQNNINTLQEF